MSGVCEHILQNVLDFFYLKWKQRQQQNKQCNQHWTAVFFFESTHPIRHEYAACTATTKYNSSLLIRWLCSSEFFAADFKMLNCIKPSCYDFFSFGVCHWWQQWKKPANVINFLKSFVRFSFLLLILLLSFSIFMTFNERYFNDDLVIILCVTVLCNFRHQFSHHSHHFRGNETKCATNGWIFCSI